jgi:hypothetical protein
MSIQLKIIRATDLLIATVQGQMDFENSKQLIETLASATNSCPGQAILLDLRNANSGLSSFDLWKLAAELKQSSGDIPGKIAVVCRMNSSSQAAFFALCAQNRGILVNAFVSFEDAVQWLTTNEQRPLERTI